ncbi:uncharacterized protein LOC130548398 isoform X2 [Triplophysa rosa]|uniref:uncharacterized protein LOC130548398 isoform X2 n=1 Tax=Triplophysa rosa TaxID=992332 RepID=UPI002545DED8|nr:uncharacterized protein LOC130548398 isoform X2 [Triplophysa rosa]
MKNLLILFCSLILSGVFGADEMNVSVMEGESVTLPINPADIKRASNLEWTFKDTIIAKIDIEGKDRPAEYPDERFRDRLKLDRQTGSLTITHITSEHSGVYQLQIRGSREMKKTFRLSVSELEPLSVNEGDSVVLHTGTETQTDDVIRWKFEGTVIAQFNRMSNYISYDDPDGRFRGRLVLNDQTGSLTITGIRSEDSGLYNLNMNNNKNIIHKRFNVTVTESSQRSHWEITVAGILVGVVLGFIMFGVSLIIYKRCRRGLNKKEENETCEQLNKPSSNINGRHSKQYMMKC